MKLTRQEIEMLHKNLFHLLSTYSDLTRKERSDVRKFMKKLSANTQKVLKLKRIVHSDV